MTACFPNKLRDMWLPGTQKGVRLAMTGRAEVPCQGLMRRETGQVPAKSRRNDSLDHPAGRFRKPVKVEPTELWVLQGRASWCCNEWRQEEDELLWSPPLACSSPRGWASRTRELLKPTHSRTPGIPIFGPSTWQVTDLPEEVARAQTQLLPCTLLEKKQPCVCRKGWLASPLRKIENFKCGKIAEWIKRNWCQMV